jgi:hypothetical protein
MSPLSGRKSTCRTVQIRGLTATPSLSHKTESFGRSNGAFGLAKGTPLSERQAQRRSQSLWISRSGPSSEVQRLLRQLLLPGGELDEAASGHRREPAPGKATRRRVECHPGKLYPRVGFIVTSMSRPAEKVVAFYNKCGGRGFEDLFAESPRTITSCCLRRSHQRGRRQQA